MSRGRPLSYHDPAFLNQDPYGDATLPTTREFYGGRTSMEQPSSSLNDGLPLFNSHTLPPPQPSHYPDSQRNSISMNSPSGLSPQLRPQFATPEGPISHAGAGVGAFVARSASLGGARKRDPFAHRADDVESGLGYGEMDGYAVAASQQSPAYEHARGRGPESFGHPPPPPSFGAPPPARNPNGPRAVSQSYAQSPGHGHPSQSTPGSMPPPPLPHQRSYHSPSPSSPYHSAGPRPRQASSSHTPQYSGQRSAAMSPASSGSGWQGSDASYAHGSQSRATGTGTGGGTLSPEVRPTSSTSQPPPSRHAYPTSQPTTPNKSLDDGRQPAHNGSGSGRSSGSSSGFRHVRDLNELRPVINVQPVGRRADSDAPGKFLSPLKCLTAALPQTYNICNPQFAYESTLNPRRVLTKPSKAEHNEGYDNEDYDYILYVNDVLGGADGGDKYLILDVLGQGTFGQVVKCQNMRTHDIVAVKVVKNKPAYLNQSKMEVAILDLLNNEWDKRDEHHILRMNESFTHRKHLCLVFECLSSNLYELIKQNQFRGLSTQLVKVFTQQLLDALQVLKEARLIHCDLKPENILLKSLQSPQIKVIDFGSACHEMQTVYTYIQSRFYRSPEVLLGLPYSTAIDMWSLGCIVVELFLGLPLFPGTSEYNQLSRIVDMLGVPPTHLLEVGKQTHEFFNCVGIDAAGRKVYRLKPMEQYATEHRTQEQPSKQYFKASKLKDIIMEYPVSKKSSKPADVEKEMTNRTAFVNFVEGLLNLDPIKRWSPQQASKHPFITGEKYTGPYEPHRQANASAKLYSPPPTATLEKRGCEKRYGGLVASPPAKGARAYQDAAAYNQQLAQHQSYTAQVQNANQYRHPFAPGAYEEAKPQAYASPSHSQPAQQTHLAAAKAQAQAHAAAQAQAQAQAHAQAAARSQRGPPQATHQRLPSQSSAYSGMGLGGVTTNPPPNSYYPASRNRANTINQMDSIPPALARLTNLGAPDPAGIRSSLTPILNRDEAIREWERRYAGPANHQKRTSMQQTSYPQLEFLQEQAEMAAQGWMHQQPSLHAQYAPPQGYTGGVSGHRHSHSGSVPVHPYHMQPELSSSSRSRGGPDYDSAPPSSTIQQQRFMPAFPPPAATTSAGPAPAFDSFDPRGDSNMALLYTPLQPQSAYQPSGGYPGGHGSSAGRHSMSGNFFFPQPPSSATRPAGGNLFGQPQSPTLPVASQKRSSFSSGYGGGST